MINPNVVEGQIAGGVVQGIGGVLLEHLAYDEDGNPVATTFMDYLLPTATDVPVIEYGHIETPSPGPGGFKGVGEGGAIGAPPAVVNAVADALSPFGVTVTRLPLTPSRIVALLGAGHATEGGDLVTTPARPTSATTLRRRDQRRSVSGVPPAARGGAALLQRGARLLRGEPVRRTSSGAWPTARRTSPDAARSSS